MVGYACFLSVGYSLNSATMAIANKWALTTFPHSGTLTCLQFGFSAGMVLLLKVFRQRELVKHIKKKKWSMIKL